MTIWETFERSKSFFSDKTAILFVNAEGKEEAYSYHKLSYDTEVFARGLKESGIGKGDNVCLCLSNSPLMITAYLALSKLGAVSVLINPVLPKNRVKKIVEDVSAKLLIDQNGAGEVFSKAHSLVALTCGATKADCGPLDTAAILYSSGTTGEQKGAELTVSNIHSNISYTSALTGMTPEDRMICFLPLTHCFGLNFILGACLYTGATLVLHEKFDLSLVLDSLVKNKVTMFFAVPQIYNMMLKQKIGPFYFSSVRYFFYAADSMSVDSILAWEQEYGRKIYTGWGLTETSPFATSNHEVIYKLGSVGKQIPGVDVKVVDEHSAELKMKKATDIENKSGFFGEICVKGHNVMKGYWNRPQETAEAIDREVWFHTGDIGYIDHEGYLFIVDRLKDMINVGGEKAWPAEIEKIILQHPEVAEVGVVGVPNEKMGEVPKAFVVAKNPALTAEEIHFFLNHPEPQLSKHEFPREIEFIDKLPRNPSGKILRRELRGK
ncbi:hypothetical protein A2W54_03580 [Candidatus Giovannonibacteria bacterium RIFCSPHIGHO2_02_43_13]|uniref:Long-chain fatty acid--CoA ligase n=1 Tax=Candidatus Giovannonibacteria bacterium RIFCSPHIGHO2_02_43_13 TaxID=1798330 RepID=A0A1F5WRJ6_9BACT|nr:MAG: hypothetical protein A3E06_00790 [Candidatus Giovannonibacteria bacterium RIFCSPHIGHO2_12_FULL_44_42]OGF77871.1 MAG: hypothetical protein A2W54_03580 [Candidatus Giovannonibacteria bacterium RIFCSPHIGHO2_02_43_13]OGF88863.1 MAG: hypothetical protein A3I94_02275 [Candidatus Giovannonibacteria bacterium RIFCSPLOWO2_02_FULL_43_54]OGF96827.1 MAG: hypothetical protein A3H08_01165 [Candidatus Giovannonibacteria bacterium RIFCSPLOWO2_12_FULL_44_32]